MRKPFVETIDLEVLMNDEKGRARIVQVDDLDS